MHLFATLVLAVAVGALVLGVTVTICLEVTERRQRHTAARRALKAAWDINAIREQTERAMWDEVTRHHQGGG